MPASKIDTSTPSLRTWLTERVAFYLDKPTEEIDPDVQLAEYGLDSVYAVSICGDIDDHLGLEVAPTLARDYPTINGMVGYLREAL